MRAHPWGKLLLVPAKKKKKKSRADRTVHVVECYVYLSLIEVYIRFQDVAPTQRKVAAAERLVSRRL